MAGGSLVRFYLRFEDIGRLVCLLETLGDLDGLGFLGKLLTFLRCVTGYRSFFICL